MDEGLATGGVLSGVLLGVDEALSTLAFLDPDRGVMLELNNTFAGVAPAELPSAAFALTLPYCAPLRKSGLGVGTGDLTFDGVCGRLLANRGALGVVEGLTVVGLYGWSRVMLATLWRLFDPE